MAEPICFIIKVILQSSHITLFLINTALETNLLEKKCSSFLKPAKNKERIKEKKIVVSFTRN